MQSIDLKGYREKAKMTQADLAKRVGKTQAQISRYEEDPESIPWNQMVELLQALGVDLRTIFSNTASDYVVGINPGTPYKNHLRDLQLLKDYAQAAPDEVKKTAVIESGNAHPTSEDLQNLASALGRKPNLIVYGRFDAGKSTVNNALLGERFLPTSYQPMTKVPTYIRDIDDRPSWFREEVWMFDRDFNPCRWDEQEYCEEHRIVAGGLETLKNFGTHGTVAGKNTAQPDAHHAIVFVNSPILKSCNIIDPPGFDHDNEDTDKVEKNQLQPDVAIYLSPLTGFMGGLDVTQLSQVIKLLVPIEKDQKNLPPLSNLYMVVTHADPSKIDEEQLKNVLEKASNRIFKILMSSTLKSRGETIKRDITLEDFRKRFFSFYLEAPNRRAPFESDLCNLLGTTMPAFWRRKSDFELESFKKQSKSNIVGVIELYKQVLGNIRAAEIELSRITQQEPVRQKRITKLRNQVEINIADYQQEAVQGVYEDYLSIVNESAIEDIIRKHFSDKKEAQEHAANFVLEQLQFRLERNVGQMGESLAKEIDGFLENYNSETITLAAEKIAVVIPFNTKGAFLGGIAGAAAVGALAAWAATLGNLGAYIIAAKAVSLLSLIGIGFSGGAAAVMSFMAAIGGPITIGIGIFVMLALAGLSIFGASWQKRLAKKIVSKFGEKNVRSTFEKAIRQYWDATLDAFKKGADEVEAKWQAYIEDLQEIISDRVRGKARLEKRLHSAEVARDFFSGIPWRVHE